MEKNEDLQKNGDSKICAVCGDSALGNNFNAITCESCKAFFRRNALKTKELQCPFKENCQITSLTRRFCQRCRLTKCYNVGMKRELIMSDAEKEKKRRKVIANKAKYGTQEISSPLQESTSSQESTECKVSEKFSDNRTVSTQTDFVCSDQNMGKYRDAETNYSTEMTQEFTPLDATQTKLLSDLVLASRSLEAPVDQDESHNKDFTMNSEGQLMWPCINKNAPKSLIDVVNLTALAIRRMIKMCKKISGFKILCEEDQISLLKQGCTQMMLLRSVSHFDAAKDSWRIPHTVEQMSQIQVDVLKEARGNIYEAHERFVRTFDGRATRDVNVMCILIAIAIFDPSKSQLIDRPTVTRNQEMYYILLQRYLESAYPTKVAQDIYHHLVMKMVELRRLNEDHVKVYLDVNPSQVEPILIEIFDLKPQ